MLRLGSFFLTKLWTDADLVSIGELQLLWLDSRGSNQPLASLRLYFLPENTPEGRRNTHGEVSLHYNSFINKLKNGSEPWVGVKNFERRNVERLIFRNFKIANIKITTDELFDNFIFEFNISFFINHLPKTFNNY